MNNAFPGQFSPIAGSFQAITLDNAAAQGLTLVNGTNGVPKYALIEVLGDPVNWRDDGVAPTAAANAGMFLPAAMEPIGFSGNLAAVKFISTSATGSTLLVSYYS